MLFRPKYIVAVNIMMIWKTTVAFNRYTHRTKSIAFHSSSSSLSWITSTVSNTSYSDYVPHPKSDIIPLYSSSSSFTEQDITTNPPTTTTTTTTAIPTKPKLLDPYTISKRVFEKDTRPIILFDGVCNLCNNAVNLALDWDPNGKLRFAALQSNIGKALLESNGRKSNDISSIVLVTGGNRNGNGGGGGGGAYLKSDAILKITEELTPLSLLPLKPAAVLGRLVVPKVLRDILYDGVADNRYDLMGKRNECRLDMDGEFNDRFVDESLAFD